MLRGEVWRLFSSPNSKDQTSLDGGTLSKNKFSLMEDKQVWIDRGSRGVAATCMALDCTAHGAM